MRIITYNNKTITRSDDFCQQVHDLSKTEIAKQIRKDLKELFGKDFKFSVTKSSVTYSRAIDVAIMSWNIEIYTEEYKQAKKEAEESNTRETWDKVQELQREHKINVYIIGQDEPKIQYTVKTEEAEKLIEAVEKIHNLYNHNRSDAMTDYFDYNYYWSVEVWKWDKPYLNTKI